jgi:PAS domain S-box-containing protein
VVTDITRLKETERALKKSEEFTFSILENTPSPIMLINTEFKIEYVNPALINLTGYKAEELLGTTFPFPWVDENLTEKAWRDATIKGVKNLEGAFKNKNGENFWVIFSTSPVIKDGEFQYSLSTWIDITERKKAQEEEKNLRIKYERAQRMEALGTLAGGIAHDFNNLLMGIQGRTSLMLLEKNSNDQEYEHLMGIEEYVKNATSLTQQLLGFARGGKYEVKPTDMNDLVKKSSDMFGQTKKEITIHTKYQEDIWTVEIDQGQMNQVLLNLYVNAWQSMPGGGDLYLETKNIVLDETYVKPLGVSSGNYVKISVTNTGVGMDEDTKHKIFDPFFTTKKMGRGTGLGLATAYGIIKNHSGIINVYSEKGEGSTFNIYLPASNAILKKEKEPSFHVVKGNETILLVDDEEMIINVGGQMLERLGYHVLSAKTGSEALETYKNNREDIDLVILDMIMPSMGGGAVYDELRKIEPGVKVLLSSGYSLNGQATSILKRGCHGFIQKPFGLDELSKKVREILESE